MLRYTIDMFYGCSRKKAAPIIRVTNVDKSVVKRFKEYTKKRNKQLKLDKCLERYYMKYFIKNQRNI